MMVSLISILSLTAQKVNTSAIFRHLTQLVHYLVPQSVHDAAKGQIISKGLFGILGFFQKTNERICFFGLTVLSFRNYLTFSITSTFQRQCKQSVLTVLLLAFGDGLDVCGESVLVNNVSNIRLSSLDKQNSFVMTTYCRCRL